MLLLLLLLPDVAIACAKAKRGGHWRNPQVEMERRGRILGGPTNAYKYRRVSSGVKSPRFFHIQSRAPGASQTHRNPIKMCRASLTRPWRAAALHIPG